MTSAVLVDDEDASLRYLERKLGELWPDLEIVGSAANGRSALSLCEELQPDIVFLDIQMPGLSGLQVADALDPDIRVVFVTAFDEFALQAFDSAAIDYLLKPIEAGRLQKTIDRLKDTASAPEAGALTEAVALIGQQRNEHLHWVRAQRGDKVEVIPVESVVYFQADNKYTTVVTSAAEHLIRTSITQLEEQLDPNRFWRVNRSTIIAISEVVSASRDIRGRYTLRLQNRPETVRTSPKYSHLFKAM